MCQQVRYAFGSLYVIVIGYRNDAQSSMDGLLNHPGRAGPAITKVGMKMYIGTVIVHALSEIHVAYFTT